MVFYPAFFFADQAFVVGRNAVELVLDGAPNWEAERKG